MNLRTLLHSILMKSQKIEVYEIDYENNITRRHLENYTVESLLAMDSKDERNIMNRKFENMINQYYNQTLVIFVNAL